MAQVAKSLISKNLRRRRRVLVVEDQREVAEMLVLHLGSAGYDVQAVFDGRSALDAVARHRPDVILLDLMLPELSGAEVASRIRANANTANIPIVMLTAKADEVDQVVGFALGADDYITKPFSIKVLLARVEAVLRRAVEVPSTADVLRLGPIEVYPESHEAFMDGQPVKLTLTEFRLLQSLIQAGGRVLSRNSLMNKAMGPGVTVTERTIDVHITSIRKKLGEYGSMIATVRGVGYRTSREAELTDA